MGLVIRVLYNNQFWQAPCTKPGADASCWQCFSEGNLEIERPSKADEICSGHCWEQHLCVDLRWGCTPQGRVYGSRAYSGQKVFFAFRQQDGKYTMWGKTTVSSLDEKPLEGGTNYEKGFAFIHFNPFKPELREKWIANLSDKQLVGNKWLMGRYRFIDAEHETYLEKLMEGSVPQKQPRPASSIRANSNTTIDLDLSPNIYQKLENIANDEGRNMDDVVKEAIAEWLKKGR